MPFEMSKNVDALVETDSTNIDGIGTLAYAIEANDTDLIIKLAKRDSIRNLFQSFRDSFAATIEADSVEERNAIINEMIYEQLMAAPDADLPRQGLRTFFQHVFI